MWVEFGEIKKHLLILLIYPIGIISVRISIYYNNNNPYFFLFIFFISHLLALIPLFIQKKIGKTSNKENNSEDDMATEQDNKNSKIVLKDLDFKVKNEITELSDELEAQNKRKKYLKLSFIAIIYFLTYTFFYYINFINPTTFYGNISMITEVFYFSLFNRIILGNKIYSHHFFSMILITISIIGVYILLIIKYIEDNPNWNPWYAIIFPTIFNFIAYLFFCFYLIKSKVYIEKYFISIYELICYLGLFCLIILLILEPISFFIPCNHPIICYEGHFAGIISGFKSISNIQEIILSLLSIIFLFMTCLGLWLTVKYLSPCHFLTSDSLITLELNIMVDFYNPNFTLMTNPLFYIFSVITIFGCLIYNEIIVIKICNLNYNTRNEIIKRNIIDFYNEDTDTDGRYSID